MDASKRRLTDAQRELVLEYAWTARLAARKYCALALRNGMTWEDLCQEGIYGIIIGIHRVQPDENRERIVKFCEACARNHVANVLRSLRAQKRGGTNTLYDIDGDENDMLCAPWLKDDAPTPLEIVETQAFVQSLSEAFPEMINKLTPTEAQVFKATIARKNAKEIAQDTGLTYRSVINARYRARKVMKKEMQKRDLI